MAYTPKYKPGDKVTLEGEILGIVSFLPKPDATEKEPMYLIGMKGSWFWAWADVVDGAKPGDPFPPPPDPPGNQGG